MGIIIPRCPQCGSNLTLNSNKCEYCGAEYLIDNISFLEKYELPALNKYLNHYIELLKDNPDDIDCNISIGLCYLSLKLYDYANKYLRRTIDLAPHKSDLYYYLCLGLIKGRNPRLLNLKEVKEIEELLNTCINLNRQPKYYYLWLVIKYEYYFKNGLIVKAPSIEELINELKSLEIKNDTLSKYFNYSESEILTLISV